ncbi:hypothetical protein D3C86_2147340 [compost metagenome]
MHGEHDEYGSVRQPEHIASAMAGPTQLEILPGRRHLPHREAEDEIVALVARFLQ